MDYRLLNIDLMTNYSEAHSLKACEMIGILKARVQMGTSVIMSPIKEHWNEDPSLANAITETVGQVIMIADQRLIEPDDEVWIVVSLVIAEYAGVVQYIGPYICGNDGKWLEPKEGTNSNHYLIRLNDMDFATEVELIKKLNSIAEGYLNDRI